MRAILIIAILFGLMSCHKKDSITQFSEENKMDKQYYVYPSTLRMLNLKENEEYNEIIDQFELGQYFSISNTSENSLLINQLKKEMIAEGYEEAMTFQDKDKEFMVYVQDKKVPKIAAIIEMDSALNIIQVEGLINIAKVPGFLKSFDNDDYLNLLDIVQDQKKQYSEHHSQD